MAETNPERSSGGGINWLTQDQVDAISEEHDEALARDAFWLRILVGLGLIGAVYMIYDAVMNFLGMP